MEIKSENKESEMIYNTIQKNIEKSKDDKLKDNKSKECNKEKIKKHNDKESQCSLISGKVNYII